MDIVLNSYCMYIDWIFCYSQQRQYFDADIAAPRRQVEARSGYLTVDMEVGRFGIFQLSKM
jgi:hypothetical protein